MSLKKTWFSYVLWFVFAGLTVLISYSVLTEVLHDFYPVIDFYTPAFSLYLNITSRMVPILVVVGVILLLHFICGKVKIPVLPKWLGIVLHVAAGLGIAAGFCVLRYQAYIHAYFWQSYSHAPSTQLQCFFELSKVGAVTGTGLEVGSVSILEQGYTYVLKTIFMFFGNKTEFLLYFQLFLQAVSLILLIVIGWTMQKGVFAWIPALLYAVMPTFFYTAEDVGITNFWSFVVILALFMICLLEKLWKKKNITYLVMVLAQLLFAGFVFFTKRNVLLYGKTPFTSGGKTLGMAWILDIEMLVLGVLLIAYCVSFWFDKQDHKTLFVLPFTGFGFLFVWLSNYEFEVSYCLRLLALLNLFFMVSQSMRVIFRAKPEVSTDRCKATEDMEVLNSKEEVLKPAEFEWAEMKEVMHSTEGLAVSVSKTEKVELAITETFPEDKTIGNSANAETANPEVVIDRKAPIENVLPMPKKHKPRVFDYAFEPSEDMMHYDVEIENDDYDY